MKLIPDHFRWQPRWGTHPLIRLMVISHNVNLQHGKPVHGGRWPHHPHFCRSHLILTGLGLIRGRADPDRQTFAEAHGQVWSLHSRCCSSLDKGNRWPVSIHPTDRHHRTVWPRSVPWSNWSGQLFLVVQIKLIIPCFCGKAKPAMGLRHLLKSQCCYHTDMHFIYLICDVLFFSSLHLVL